MNYEETYGEDWFLVDWQAEYARLEAVRDYWLVQAANEHEYAAELAHFDEALLDIEMLWRSADNFR